jgi:hypothetical protein
MESHAVNSAHEGGDMRRSISAARIVALGASSIGLPS